MYESNQFIPLIMRFLLSLQFDCLPLQLPPMLFRKEEEKEMEKYQKPSNST